MTIGFAQAFGGGGSGSGGYTILRYIKTSQTFVAPFSGKLSVLLVAGHGGGAAAYNTYATGAGAGEAAMKFEVSVTAGDSYVITIGAGGAASATGFSAATTANGGNGGNSTIVGPGLNMSVVGGGGGQAATTAPLSGGYGGTGGTGGDWHFAGGRGGNMGASASSSSPPTGSGSVNLVWQGTDTTKTRGGDKTGSGDGATGGGGVGGRGGDVIGTTVITSAAGGYGGDAADVATNVATAIGGANALGVRSVSSSGVTPTSVVPALAMWGLNVFGGGNANSNGVPAPGGGGGSSSSSMNSGALTTFMGGVCGTERTTAGSANSVTGLNGPGQSIRGVGVNVSGSAGDSGLCVLILQKG